MGDLPRLNAAVSTSHFRVSLNQVFSMDPGPFGLIPSVLGPLSARKYGPGPRSDRARRGGVDPGPRVSKRGVSVHSQPETRPIR